MKNNLLLCGALAGMAFGADATVIDFTYNVNNDEPKVYGFNKKETYDVAIKIADPLYIGAKVKGFTVALPVGQEAVKDLSGWLSTELKLVNKKNAPDIASKEGVLGDEMLSVTFDEPYTISGEGVWVGYSLTITNLDEENNYPDCPVAVVNSEDNLDNGLWIHTSRSRLKWTNLGQTLGAVSCMTVKLDMDFGPDDAAIVVPQQSYMLSGKPSDVPFRIANHGSSPLEDIEYSYSIGETVGKNSVHLDNPIAANGGVGEVNLVLGPVEKNGVYPLKVTLEKSNGKVNNDPGRSGEGTMNVWPFIPVTRPLVEEFTALGCGWCPRGYVAMEYLKESMGDLFVGLAYHSEQLETGCMVTVPDKDFCVSVPGLPYSDFNRKDAMDPYLLPYRWDKYASQISTADVNVKMDWEDEQNRIVKITSEVSFVEDMDNADYSIAYALVADGLKNDKWKQSNYYDEEEEGDGVESPLWDIFLGGPAKVSGLTFNDVVVYFKDVKGVAGSVPETVKAGEKLTHDYYVNLTDIKNLKGEYFINPEARIHAVAILLDGKTGYSVNCNKSGSVEYGTTGIGQIVGSDAEAVESVYYNLQGIRVDNPSEGVYVVTDILSDGTKRTRKAVVK